MKKVVRIMRPSKDFEKANKGKEKYLILEVGNYNTKMIEVSSFPGKMIVHKGFIIATPEGTLEDNVVVKPDELINQLAEKIKEEKITSRNVTLSLSSGDIITREMAVPKMSKRDTLSFIKINSNMTPSGDQPKAINALVNGLKEGLKSQTWKKNSCRWCRQQKEQGKLPVSDTLSDTGAHLHRSWSDCTRKPLPQENPQKGFR